MQSCISILKIFLSLIIVSLQIQICKGQPIATSIAPKYNGDTVTITGRIYAGNFLKNVITKPTFLNVYDSSPMHMIMIRIDSNDRKNFPDDPEKYYLNKKVSIKGVLADYKGIATMKINAPSVVEIDANDNGPEPITSTGSYMSGHEFGFGRADSIFRHKQDSINKILAADPKRKNKGPKYITAETLLESHDKKQSQTDSAVSASSEEQPSNTETVTPPATDTEIPTTDTVPVTKKDETEETDTDTTIVESTNETQPATNTNPVIKSDKKNLIDTAAKASYLKTITKQEFVTVNELWEVKEGEIEMRTSPTMDSPVLAYLMKKMTIRITNRSKKWSYVTVENPDGTIGLSGFIKNKNYKELIQK